MKNSSFLWSILAIVCVVLTIEQVFAASPFEYKPNWLAILPAAAIWVALIGLVIRKKLTAAESRTRKEKAEPTAVYASTQLDNLT